MRGILDFGIKLVKPGMTLEELCSWYFKDYAPLKLKLHTIDNSRRLMELYILPVLGDARIKDITPVQLDELFSDLLIRGRQKDGKGLRAGCVCSIRAVLSTICSAGVKKGMIQENPVRLSARPRTDQSDKKYLTLEQCMRVLEEADQLKNRQTGNAIKLLLYTGMRSGELTALQWEDIGKDMASIRICHTLYRRKGEVRRTETKTQSSMRTIPSGEAVKKILREQYLITGEAGRSIFTNKNGDYMNGGYLNNQLKKILKPMGLDGVHAHDLRHAAASILINNAVPMKAVAELLGHSSTEVTEKVYTHIYSSTMRSTAQKLDAVLSGREKESATNYCSCCN